ncbi:MAG: ATP-binding protein [Limnohabitans sp.]|nr:ATP-binding protein [Limnohabitans sp.]
MITRIKIDGFKSLLNTELYMGTFTCIAGANAAGKSNFFDAILFLSRLADDTILQAAKSIRSENLKHSNINDIFYKSGSDRYNSIKFEIDMLIPKEAIDDLGQTAKATITSLRYTLELEFKSNEAVLDRELIELVKEELVPITQTETKNSLKFNHTTQWLNSVLYGRRSTRAPFISTENEKIKLHQDGNKGRTSEFIAEKMPRTLLSTVTAESPTAFLVRQEMRNWNMLQFEPSAMRNPNTTYEVKNAEITANGSNLPATTYRLLNEKKNIDLYQTLTNKLKELVSDVDEINVDKDEKRDLLTLQVKFKGGLVLPAQSLSDGTLRFLALAIINEDNKSNGIICLEEPENGINPKKIKEMVNLLKDMATDTDYEVADDNPLRQVIINSHSPLVVSLVPDDSLLLAKEKEYFHEPFNKKIKYTGFACLHDTWRDLEKITLGEVYAYLDTTPDTNTIDHQKPLPKDQNKPQNTTKRTVAENINQLQLFKYNE